MRLMKAVQPVVHFPRHFLDQAMERVLQGGSNAAGVDGIRLDDIREKSDEFLDEIEEKLTRGIYQPSRVKELTIDQYGKKRKIGILTVEDRIVHTMVKCWLEPICQPKFNKSSYAYQSGKSANQAVEEIEAKLKEGYKWIGETDIQNFFDEIDHEWLRSLLLTFVDDKERIDFVLYLFNIYSVKGIIQGSPLSPLLANIFLNSFDDYMVRDEKPYIRFSDDIVLLDDSKESVEVRLNLMKDALKALKLQWNEKKTAVKHLSETFTFLGFTFSPEGKNVAEKGVKTLSFKLDEVSQSSDCYRTKEENYLSILRGWQQYFNHIPWKDIENLGALHLIEEFEKDSTKQTEIYNRILNAANLDVLDSWHFSKLAFISKNIGRNGDALFWLSFHYEKDAKLPEGLKNWLLSRYSLKEMLYEEFFHHFLELHHNRHHEDRVQNLSEWLLEKDLFLLAKELHEPVLPIQAKNSKKIERFDENDIFSEFLTLFSGKEDRFLVESYIDGKRTFSPIHRALNKEDVKLHYSGELTVVQSLIRSNKTVSYAVIDIDVAKNLIRSSEDNEFLIEKKKVAFTDALKLVDTARRAGFHGQLVDSGYRGYHIWFFFAEPVDLKYAFLFLSNLVSHAGGPSEEIVWERFPKQKKLSDGKSGQAIKLPWGKHSVSNKQSWFLDHAGNVIQDQFSIIKKVKKITRERLLTFVQQPNVQDKVAKNRLPIEEATLPQSIRMILNGCPVMRHMVEKAKNTSYLNHQERLLMLNVFAPIGEEGYQFIHRVIGQTMNYNPGTTEKFIKRSYNKPISCIRIREHFPGLTAQLPCNCQFPLKKGGYPSPVLHHQQLEHLVQRKPQKNEIKKDKSVVVKDASEKVAASKTTEIQSETPIQTQKVNELALKLIELRKQQRGVTKRLRYMENELSQLFDEQKVDQMEIELGSLIRQKKENLVE